jgi:hypothetical protein
MHLRGVVAPLDAHSRHSTIAHIDSKSVRKRALPRDPPCECNAQQPSQRA